MIKLIVEKGFYGDIDCRVEWVWPFIVYKKDISPETGYIHKRWYLTTRSYYTHIMPGAIFYTLIKRPFKIILWKFKDLFKRADND